MVSHSENEQVKFKNFTCNKLLTDFGATNNIDDINNFDDQSMEKGITIGYPGWAIFEMEREVSFNSLEIGCYLGKHFSYGNLDTANILASTDNINWILLVSVIINKVEIIKLSFQNTTAKYIKVDHTLVWEATDREYHLGIGYLKVLNNN